MSALDQAFIRAYAKDLSHTATAQQHAAASTAPQYAESPGAESRPSTTRILESTPRVVWRIDDPGWGPSTPSIPPAPHWTPASAQGYYGGAYGPPAYYPQSFPPPAAPSPAVGRFPVPPLAPAVELGYSTLPIDRATREPEVVPPTPARRFDGPHARGPLSPHFVLVASSDNETSESLPATIAALDLPSAPLVASSHFDPATLAEASREFEVRGGEAQPEVRSSVNLSRPDSAEAERDRSTGPFRPRWEVDAFEWPEICDKLLAERNAAFEALARNLVAERGSTGAIVGLAGCLRGDGKSTVALCLARAAATAGLKVALVDADFDHPDLAERLNVEIGRGWEAALDGQATLAESTVAAIDLRINLVPLAGPIDDTPGEIALGLSETLELLAGHHDLVLVDLGTLPADPSVLPEPPALANGMRAIVVRDGRSESENRLGIACGHLRAAGLNVIGVIDNFQAT